MIATARTTPGLQPENPAKRDSPRRPGSRHGRTLTAVPTRILVVEDDPDVRGVLEDVLQAEGYSVGTAANGLEALNALRNQRYGIVLLDLMMPVMNGWQFLDARAADPALADIPVIAVTAVTAAHLPPVRTLRKPFELSELIRAIREVGSEH
jgi:CheY-like chemotaxis protein